MFKYNNEVIIYIKNSKTISHTIYLCYVIKRLQRKEDNNTNNNNDSK
jgi:hypothetical protein